MHILFDQVLRFILKLKHFYKNISGAASLSECRSRSIPLARNHAHSGNRANLFDMATEHGEINEDVEEPRRSPNADHVRDTKGLCTHGGVHDRLDAWATFL
jgi:hypothetical protein